ncbi:MAG: murein biosynthesis integral membrane protein MurJ, partial [Aggregatilineales bacterium]
PFRIIYMDAPRNQTEAIAQSDAKASRNRHIFQSTALLMILFGITKVISLGQTFIIANSFGIGTQWDAYVSANRIPELIVVLISGGALGHAFIPTFSGLIAKGETDRAWKLSSHVINVIFSLALVISVIVFVLTPVLMSEVIAPGFDAETTASAITLMRILLLGTIIFSVSGIVSAILHSHNHFLLPALAPIMYDLGILFGVIVLLKPFGINGVAIGTVIGAAAHLAIQIPGLIRFRAKWLPELGLRDPLLWRVAQLMLPRIVGLGVFQFNMLIMNNLGSRLGVGSISALDWGWRLMQIPQTLIGTAMGIVIFPTLAALSEVQDDDGKRDAMSNALRFIMMASIPSAIGLIVVGQPLISLLERGAFDASASALVYTTLRAFTLGLIVHSALEVVARSFYADKDTVTPLWAAMGGATINLVLAYLLSDIQTVEANTLYNSIARQLPLAGFDPVIGNVSGLALANSLGVTFEVLMLLWILRRRWHGIHESALTQTTLKTLAASLIMALAILGIELVWNVLGLAERGILFTILLLALEIIGGGLVFIGAALLLQMEELRYAIRMILRRRHEQQLQQEQNA